MQEAARKRGDAVAWYLEPTAGNPLRDGEIRLLDFDEARAWQPDAIYAPGNWLPDFLPGLKVEIFHGFGIDKKGHFRIRGWFDLYCTHGPMTTAPFEALAQRHGHFAVRETGWPKADQLFNSQPDPAIRQRFANPELPLVLYAPTFSPSLTSTPELADKIMQSANEGKWNWLVKFHPKMSANWVQRFVDAQNANLQVASSPDISSLLHTADVMLTDTSSVLVEFMLLDKPVVTFRNLSPGPHHLDFRNASELDTVIQSVLDNHDALRNAARQYAGKMHPYRDGKSSERVLDAVEQFINEDGQSKLRPKPLNVWRKLKARFRTRYFRIR